MTKFSWTFEPVKDNEYLKHLPENERFIQVFATTFEKAVKKVLKLKLPNVESQDDLIFVSVQEEAYGDDDDMIPQTEN